MNCEVHDPKDLDRHYDNLIRTQANFWPMHYSRSDCLCAAYNKIEQIIQRNNPHMTLAKTFHIPPPQPDIPDPPEMQHDEQHPMPNREELFAQADTMAQSLNTEQQAAYAAIIQSILNHEGKAFFIDGPGGTGKTYLYKTLTKWLHSLGLTISACASTGIAATLIDALQHALCTSS
jgi:hypothetical protein